jgi:hypothetical protein
MTALPVGTVDDKPLINDPRGVLAMRKLMILVLTFALLGAATAATADTLSCSVAGPNPPVYTPDDCYADRPGIRHAYAKFRVDPSPPLTVGDIREVRWFNINGDARDSLAGCSHAGHICSVLLNANQAKAVEAVVLYFTAPGSIISASASFGDGQ